MSCALGEVRLSSITSALCCWFQGHISSGLGNSTYCLAYLWNALSVWWSLLVICSSYSLFTCLLHSSLSVEFCMGLFGFYWWTSAENVAVLLWSEGFSLQRSPLLWCLLAHNLFLLENAFLIDVNKLDVWNSNKLQPAFVCNSNLLFLVSALVLKSLFMSDTYKYLPDANLGVSWVVLRSWDRATLPLLLTTRVIFTRM